MLAIINFALTVVGVLSLVGGVLTLKDCIKKQNFSKNFGEGVGMLVFGMILTMAWINSIF